MSGTVIQMLLTSLGPDMILKRDLKQCLLNLQLTGRQTPRTS